MRAVLICLLGALGAAAARAETPAAVAARVDRAFADAWAAEKLAPAAPADDAEFLRRASLDLIGRVPTVAEARAFLADDRPDRRDRLVAGLMGRPAYKRHFTAVWRDWLLPEAGGSLQARLVAPGFEAWLRRKLDDDIGYDQLVRELLTAPLNRDGANAATRRKGLRFSMGQFSTTSCTAVRTPPAPTPSARSSWPAWPMPWRSWTAGSTRPSAKTVRGCPAARASD